MASFEVHWRPSTKKDLRSIPAEDVTRILAAVETLADDPFRMEIRSYRDQNKLTASESAIIEWYTRLYRL